MDALEAWIEGIDPAGVQFTQATFTVAIFVTLWIHPWTWGNGDKK